MLTDERFRMALAVRKSVILAFAVLIAFAGASLSSLQLTHAAPTPPAPGPKRVQSKQPPENASPAAAASAEHSGVVDRRGHESTDCGRHGHSDPHEFRRLARACGDRVEDGRERQVHLPHSAGAASSTIAVHHVRCRSPPVCSATLRQLRLHHDCEEPRERRAALVLGAQDGPRREDFRPIGR